MSQFPYESSQPTDPYRNQQPPRQIPYGAYAHGTQNPYAPR